MTYLLEGGGKRNDQCPRRSASPLPRAGIAPSCCIHANISMTAQLSVIWPFAKRAKRICWIWKRLPEGGMPKNAPGPVWVPVMVIRMAALSSSAISSRRFIMIDGIWRDQLVGYAQVALVEELLTDTAGDELILFS